MPCLVSRDREVELFENTCSNNWSCWSLLSNRHAGGIGVRVMGTDGRTVWDCEILEGMSEGVWRREGLDG